MTMMDLEYEWFKRKIADIVGVDLNGYKPEQMKRLLARVLEQAGARNYVDYVKMLKENPGKIREFRDKITINVSSLFRDTEKWRELERMLPELARSSLLPAVGGRKRGTPRFRAWSVGCSIGAEPVSLAVLLEELRTSEGMVPFTFDVLATDIDLSIIQRAREGVFTDKEMEHVPHKLMKKYFRETPRPEAAWAKKSTSSVFHATDPEILSSINFRFQNLMDANWEKDFHLIVCRNVLIYFNRKVIDELVGRFSESLLPGGILFIGGTELIFNPDRVGLKPIASSFYKKTN